MEPGSCEPEFARMQRNAHHFGSATGGTISLVGRGRALLSEALRIAERQYKVHQRNIHNPDQSVNTIAKDVELDRIALPVQGVIITP